LRHSIDETGEGAGVKLREQQLRKVQPKLRMVANGSTEVNALRAECAAAVAVTPRQREALPARRSEDAAAAARDAGAPVVPKGRLTRPADALVSVFVGLRGADVNTQLWPAMGLPVKATKGGLATAELPLERALELAASGEVSYVELGQPLSFPTPQVEAGAPAAPPVDERRFGDARGHRHGAGVLIGLVDVGGFDFAHPDFLERGRTRFLSIWDQGGETRPSPAERHTAPFDYGAELVADDLNAAIAGSAQAGLPPHVLEPQSQMAPGSHGTHVASIVAGNRGICRRAEIVAVLISIPEDELARRESFYDSTRLAHAVDYLLATADRLGRPISINISLGTNGHAHDDSSPVARWIDASLARPGRCVSVAAGNAGQERAEHEGDVAWMLGRVHAGGRIPARELVHDLEWNVIGNGLADVSENELEVWYGAQDRLSVQVKPPGAPWTEVVRPYEYIENRKLPDGSFLSVYNELYQPANGANLIAVYLSPQLREGAVIGVMAGQWLIRLIGDEVRDGRFDCWIERDDPRRVGRVGDREAWAFPSFFSERSYVDRSTISSLACGPRIVAVANLDRDNRRINITSSQGPTRDGREKPDIAAPGTGVVAAKGFDPGERWIPMTGTSMASPHVAGVAGLMLAINDRLTSAQIGGILKRTARPLPGADFNWRDDAGAGEIDEERCLEEAARVGERRDLT
jgi:subtilisin family serine protease